MDTQKVVELIETERKYQNAKWGNNPHSNADWLVIATEEAGEVAQAVIGLWDRGDEVQANRRHIIHELVQHAAVLVAWIEDRTADMSDEDFDQFIWARKAQTKVLANMHERVDPILKPK